MEGLVHVKVKREREESNNKEPGDSTSCESNLYSVPSSSAPICDPWPAQGSEIGAPQYFESPLRDCFPLPLRGL